MTRNLISRTSIFAVLAAMTVVSAIAGTEALWERSGFLDDREYTDYNVIIGPGDYEITGFGRGAGDLDLRFFDDDGTEVAKDTMADNLPMLGVHVPSRRECTIRVENASPYAGVRYDLVVE